MSKFAIRLLTLAVYATALVAIPLVTPAKAVTDGSNHVKKRKKPVSNGPGIGDPRPSSQMRSNPYDDPDRKVGY